MKIPILAILLLVAGKAVPRCYESPDTLVCKDVYVESDKPIQFNTSLTKLNIERANGSIGHRTFSSMPQLEEISIANSHINHVEDGVLCSIPKLHTLNLQLIDNFPILAEALLSNCHYLAKLSLGYVQLEPKVFKNLANLKYLSLNNINISHLTAEYMEPLRNLEDLSFFECNIDRIDPGVLRLSSKLEILKMYRVTNLPSLTKSLFENCNRVAIFMFEYNTDIHIDEDAFSGLINLRWLVLGNVNIGHLKRSFLRGLPNLEDLNLSRAGIVKIDPDFFTSFDRLRHLSLSGNMLSEVDYPSMIRSLPNLLALTLENTTLATIDNMKHPKLRTLEIRCNVISKINATAVKENFPDLQTLSIACNKMNREEERALKTELSGIFVLTTDDLSPTTCEELIIH